MEWTGENVKRLRTQLKLSQSEFGRKIGLNRNDSAISSAISRIELGTCQITYGMSQKLDELYAGYEPVDVTPETSEVITEKPVDAVAIPDNGIELVDGVPMVTSLYIAKRFDKEHYNVLQNIVSLMNSESVKRREKLLTFQELFTRTVNGQNQKYFRMNKSAALTLVTEFTGEMARGIRVQLIDDLDRLEQERLQPALPAEPTSGDMNILIRTVDRFAIKTEEAFTQIEARQADGFHLMSVKIEEVDKRNEERANRQDTRLATLEDRIPERRRNPSPDTQKELLRTCKHMMHGRCAMCKKQILHADGTPILRDEKTGLWLEFDHFYKKWKNQPWEMWTLCNECNQRCEKVTKKSEITETEHDFEIKRENDFKGFQFMRERLNDELKRRKNEIILVNIPDGAKSYNDVPLPKRDYL